MRKTARLLKANCSFLSLMIHVQVALALRAHAILSAFENLLMLIYPKLHSKRVVTYSNCCEKYYFN